MLRGIKLLSSRIAPHPVFPESPFMEPTPSDRHSQLSTFISATHSFASIQTPAVAGRASSEGTPTSTGPNIAPSSHIQPDFLPFNSNISILPAPFRISLVNTPHGLSTYVPVYLSRKQNPALAPFRTRVWFSSYLIAPLEQQHLLLASCRPVRLLSH